MRYVRSLALLAIAACALMASIASPASATAVIKEPTGIRCSTSVLEEPGGAPEIVELNTAETEGCPIRGAATDLEFSGIFGAMAVCDVNLEGMISEGDATVGDWATAGRCADAVEAGNVTPCPHLGERHVRANIKSGAGAGPFPSEMSICFVMFDSAFHCDDVAFTLRELAAHNYKMAFAHSNACQGAIASIQGTITQVIDAAHPKIEVR
jgi:hypothetical protein